MSENKETNFVSAVVYVRNSENRISDFLKMLISVFEDNFQNSEIICVNDCSTDNSVKMIKETANDSNSVSISIMNMSCFHGREIAINAGVGFSVGDYVFEFDDSFRDFDSSEIMKAYNHLLTGFDIVSAVPNRKEKFTSRLFYKIFDSFSDASAQMHTESFRVLSRRVINRVESVNKTIPYRKAVYAKQGLKTDKITYEPLLNSIPKADRKERKYRKSLAVDSLILFTQIGYRFSITMTMLMMFMSAFMIIYSIIVFFTASPVEGWTTTILFLSVSFLGLFGLLTIVIKYLQLLVNLVFKRKQYSCESIERVSGR